MSRSIDTYRGQRITAETLKDLAPELPQDIQEKADQWVSENKELVRKLLTRGKKSEWKTEYIERKAELEQQDIKNL